MLSGHTLDGFQRRQPLPLGQRGQHLLSPAPAAHWPVEVSMGSTFGTEGAWFHIGSMYEWSQSIGGIFVAYAANTRHTTNSCLRASYRLRRRDALHYTIESCVYKVALK